ncbi:MAG: 4-hydroxybenzoate octaprenyltransferase [Gammaproteobacteria bacterium]|nr:4-hydroxybenzoate octaprenyltransferase [Gammaproteobacteria bacterium]
MAEGPAHSLACLGNELVAQARQYAQLMRLDKPVGIWLLLWPTLWGLWIAGAGRPEPLNFLVFVAGVVVMRSAGCVINDYADRHIDGEVARTQSRPLAAGLVTSAEALTLFAVLGLVALALLMLLNPLARLLAIGGAALTIVYPFSKRWLAAPQFLLGAAFGWGIPMAFAAETEVVPRLAWLLWLDVVVWAVIYDTMYAMADRDEDLRIGVKSTAILFGTADLFIIFLLQIVLVIGLLLAGRDGGLGLWYQAGVAVGALLLASQLWLIRGREPVACLRAFRANQHFGAAIFAGILLDYTFRSVA